MNEFFAVIKHFDVLEDATLRFCSCLVSFLMNQFLLQRRKETFHCCVVVSAVSLTAHAAGDPVGLQHLLVMSLTHNSSGFVD